MIIPPFTNLGKKKFKVSVTLPDDFPKKYRKAVLSAANTCTVKKVIQAIPEFEMVMSPALPSMLELFLAIVILLVDAVEA